MKHPLLVLALAACGSSSTPARAPAPPAAEAAAECAPYLESRGYTYDLPPSASVTFTVDGPLAIVSREPGALVVEPTGAPGFAVRDPGGSVRAFFGEDTDLGDGVRARAGATTTLRTPLDEDRFEVDTVGELVRTTPCHALAATRPPPPAPWEPWSPRPLGQGTNLVSEAGTTLLWLDAGQTVEVFEVEDARALVRVEIDGYLLAGWIDASALEPVGALYGDEYGHGGWGYGLVGTGLASWQPCTGRSILRRGATLKTGARDESGVTTLPSFEAPVDVELLAAHGPDRRVQITRPLPGLESLVVWVDAADVSPDCPLTPP